MAVKPLYHKDGRGKPLAVGVLVGATKEKLGDAVIYLRFHVHSAAFVVPPDAEPESRGRRATSKQDLQGKLLAAQERYGYHTFRRGDEVEYLGSKSHRSSNRLEPRLTS